MSGQPGKLRPANHSAIHKRTTYRPALEELEGRWLPSGGLAIAPDGDVWFRDISYVGRIQPGTGLTQYYYLPPGTNVLGDLAFANDGNLWMNVGNGLLRFNPATGSSEAFYLAPGRQTGMIGRLTAAADGNLWFFESSAKTNWVASLNSATGAIREYLYNGTLDLNGGVAIETDGTAWFAASVGQSNYVFPVQLNPATGVITEFRNAAIGPSNLVTGSDGNIWSFYGNSGFGKWDPNSQTASFIPFSNAFSTNNYMTAGTDGGIWIPLLGDGMQETINLARMDPGTLSSTVFSPPFGNNFGSVQGVAIGGDGTVWVSNALAIIHFNPATGAFQEFSITGTPPGFSYAGNFIIPPPPGAFPRSASAGIDWGDGTTSSPAVTVTLVTPDGEWNVLANHSYRFPGTYTIQVTMVFNQFGGFVDSLQTSFTAVIEGSAGSNSPPSTSPSTKNALAAIPLDIAQAYASTNPQASFYTGSTSTAAPLKASDSVIQNSATPVYQNLAPKLTSVPFERGTGELQPTDDPLEKKSKQPPTPEATNEDSGEALPVSRSVVPDRESVSDAPTHELGARSNSVRASSEDFDPLGQESTLRHAILTSDELEPKIEENLIYENNPAGGEFASLAFLAAFSREAIKNSRPRKHKKPKDRCA